MSFLNQTRDPRRRTTAIVAVAAIHAMLAYTVVTGLGVEIRRQLAPPRLDGEQIPLPPPPPKPTPPRSQDPIVSRPEAAIPPIPLPPAPGPTYEPFDGTADPFTGTSTDPAPPLPRPLPSPGFTPKRAVPSNSSATWITTDDYPRRALVAGVEGAVGYRLVVAATGRVASCELTRPSGNRALDDATCRLIASRARFEPATDETGANVPGTFTGSVRWEIPQ